MTQTSTDNDRVCYVLMYILYSISIYTIYICDAVRVYAHTYIVEYYYYIIWCAMTETVERRIYISFSTGQSRCIRWCGCNLIHVMAYSEHQVRFYLISYNIACVEDPKLLSHIRTNRREIYSTFKRFKLLNSQ